MELFLDYPKEVNFLYSTVALDLGELCILTKKTKNWYKMQKCDPMWTLTTNLYHQTHVMTHEPKQGEDWF